MRLVSAVLLLTVPAFAQSGSSTNVPPQIEPRKEVVVVTGSYEPVPLEESERTVRIFDAGRDRTLVNSVSEYLQMDSSVDLRRRAPGDVQADLSIRGGTFSQTLVLLNGMRLNNAQTGHHTMDLPVSLDAISEIQVLHGSGSTQYGSDAVTGVVNLIVKPPSTEARIRGALGNFGTNSESGTVALSGSRLMQSFVFSRDFSTGFMPDRDYRNLSLSSITHASTSLGATDILLAHSDRPFGADQFYGDYPSWERTKGWFASLRQEFGTRTEVDFSFRRGSDLFVLYRDQPEIFTNRHVLESWDAAARRHEDFGTASRLSYGVESYVDRIDSNNLGQHSRARGAGYVSWDARVLRRFSLTVGLRDEFYGSFNHELSPTFAGGVWLNSRVKLRAAVSRAFRVPTYTDLYYHDPANVGSPNLRPEKAWNYEGGADWQIASRLRASATVFHRRDTDVIDYVRYSPTDIYRATNFQRLHFTGFEGMVEWAPRNGHVINAQYTAMNGDRVPEPGTISKYVFNYPIHSGVVTWQGRVRSAVAFRTRIGVVERYERDPYAVWDLSATRATGRVRPFVQFTNLTSTVYQEIPGVALPKFGVLGGVEWRLYGDVH
jgi:iron complex outermembrane receptor protein